MPMGIRLGLGLGSAITVGAASSLLPLGARLVGFGHSKVSQSSSAGRRNFILTALSQLNGRYRLAAAGGDQGIGGNTQDQIAARIAFTTAQQPDVIVLQTDHNSLGDGAATVIAKNDALDAAIAAASPNSIRVWMTETPSNVYPPGNATIEAVNADLIAKAGGKRMVCNSAATFVYATDTYDLVHPNWTGAEKEGAVLAACLDSLVATQTQTAALQDTSAAREHGANLDPLYSTIGTGLANGTKAGTGSANITGTVPDYFTLTNNTTASINVVGVDTVNGMSRITLDITGTGVTEGYIELKRQNAVGGRVPMTMAIGDVAESLLGVDLTATDGTSAPSGLMFASLSSGQKFSYGTYLSADANLQAPFTSPLIGRLERTVPAVQQTALTNTLPAYGVRVAGTVNLRIRLYGWISRKTDLVATALPALMSGDGIHSSSTGLGLSGGATTLNNGTQYTFQEGEWSGGAPVFTKQVDISTDGGSTWSAAASQPNASWQWTPSGYATGTKVRLTVTDTNTFGAVPQSVVFTVN